MREGIYYVVVSLVESIVHAVLLLVFRYESEERTDEEDK